MITKISRVLQKEAGKLELFEVDEQAMRPEPDKMW
jgi:hypothetical protein